MSIKSHQLVVNPRLMKKNVRSRYIQTRDAEQGKNGRLLLRLLQLQRSIPTAAVTQTPNKYPSCSDSGSSSGKRIRLLWLQFQL